MTGFGMIRGPRAAVVCGAAWGMVQRRESARYRWRLLLSGVALTGLLAAAIQLGNAVTGLRREVQDLTRASRNLEARRAQLAVRWNTASSRQVVLRRAQTELGLINQEAPAAILVTTRDEAGRSVQPLRRLPRLGPIDPIPAALAAPDAP